MTVKLQHDATQKFLEVHVSGKLSKEDYAELGPKVESLIKEHGKIRILFEMHDFHGWEMSALWEDIKFDIKHFKDVERLAFVGEKKWQEGMTKFCGPFTTATIRYFDHADIAEARTWLATA